MDAVWMVRERQLASRMRFWTAIVGYDPRDRSLSHRLYLFYLLIFFSLWGFAVLALMADLGIRILSLFEGIPPVKAAILIITILLLADFLLRGYRYARRSPFTFSEEDAALICQTPVDRRQVAIAWMLGDWFPTILPYLVLVVVLCFANIQLNEQGDLLWSHLPIYWLAGFRVASIVIPTHMALMAVVYALGALRLREDRDNRSLRWIPVGLAASIISLAFVNIMGLQLLLWPLFYLLASGFGVVSWLTGFSAAITLAVLGLLALYIASPRLNLSRAAQESRFKWEHQQVSWLGDSRLIRQMKLREQLGTGHTPSRIPGRAGVWALIWKNWVISLRVMRVGQIGAWIGIFAAGLGMMVAPNWGVRIWAFIFWAVLISKRCTERIRSDLELWVISQQLPFRRERMVIAEIAQPVIGAICLTWLAYGIGYWLGYKPSGLIPWLLPGIIFSIALMAVLDILRRCKSSELLAGQVVDIGAGGLVLLLLLAGVPGVLIWWIISRPIGSGIHWLVILAGFSLIYGISFVIWKLSADTFRAIK
jgi:hypothetical protein